MAFVVACTVLACGAGAALGGTFNPAPGDITIGTVGGLKYKLDPNRFNPTNDAYGQEDVYCGPGWHVTSGGARLAGAISAKYMESTGPFSFGDSNTISDNGWGSSGYGPGTGRLTDFAICSRAGYRYLYSVVPSGVTAIRSAKLSCGGPAWHVVGGGGTIATVHSDINTSAPFDGPDTDTRPDDGWAIRVLDTAAGNGGMSIDAICRRGPGLTYVRKEDPGLSASTGSTVHASCNPQGHVIGGGVRISGPGDQARVAGSFPADSADPGKVPDDGWNGAAYSGGGPAKTITVTAICLG